MMVMIYCNNNISLRIVSPHSITLYICNLYNYTVIHNIGDRRNKLSDEEKLIIILYVIYVADDRTYH